MALSSLAGPAVNLIMAVIFTLLLRVVIAGLEGHIPKVYWTWFFLPLTYMLFYGVMINVVLAVLNLIPIPPLDGSRVAYWLLPDKQAALYYRLEPYGMFILVGLIMFDPQIHLIHTVTSTLTHSLSNSILSTAVGFGAGNTP